VAGDPSGQSRGRERWLLLLALLLPLAGLALLDLGLGAAGLVPPEHPLLFYERTRSRFFSPFVAGEDGSVAIRPDWVNDGGTMRGRRGKRAGRHVLYPGFRPARFSARKPEGGLRVFALGGSTTFGLYVGSEQAFPAQLEGRLRARFPDREVEVINLGCPGWASDRVANVLDAVLEFEPDLVLVYTGHNEMLEGHVGAPGQLGAALRLRAQLMRVSTLFAWLDHALTSRLRAREFDMIREEAAALEAGHILTYEPRQVPPHRRSLPGPEFFERAAAEYAVNLRAMVDQGRAAGVPVVFVLPISNLLSPPALITGDGDATRDRELWRETDLARRALEEQRVEDGLRHLDRAVELSPRNALAHHQRGRALAAAGRRREALVELQRAVDLDLRTHRLTTPLEAAFIEAVEGAGGRWIDPRPAFRRSLGVDAAQALFIDHLHPTPLGHARLAELALPVVSELLAPGP
jgi:lysophospholipase L1-like esterase